MKNQIYAPVIGNKLLFNAINNKCKKHWWESVDQLYGYHFKADTRIDFHAKQGNINVDTDTAVVLLLYSA